jgi:hypothetical protein
VVAVGPGPHYAAAGQTCQGAYITQEGAGSRHHLGQAAAGCGAGGDRADRYRTTAQRLTANMRAEMRRTRMEKALVMLRSGKSKAEVARTFGLSPSRVSAMFKGMTFPKRRKPVDSEDDDDEPADGTVPFWRRRTRTLEPRLRAIHARLQPTSCQSD